MAAIAQPYIVHSVPGRVRVHLPHWSGRAENHLARRLLDLPGVHEAQANPFTRNILLTFDVRTTSAQALLAQLSKVPVDSPPAPSSQARSAPPTEPPQTSTSPSVVTEGSGREKRARIAVRGLERNPLLAGRLVQQLEKKHGVKARAKFITGHVHVEYDEFRVALQHIIAEVARLELPALPGEDRPEHPLDPAPLIQSVTRAIGSLLGLAFITYRRLAAPTLPGNSLATIVAGAINLLEGFPVVHHQLRHTIGRNQAYVLSGGLGIIALTLANFPLGLVLTGVESLLVLGEVMARRNAWIRYEDSLVGCESTEPGASIRLETGMRVPRTARVVEGTGSATHGSGLPVPLSPGTIAPAGAVITGGPVVMELLPGDAFEPEPRPLARPATFYDRYVGAANLVSIAFAVVNGFRLSSWAHAFEALLLLNPRPAVVGRDVANLQAASRTLRGGMTVVGTRPERIVQVPHVLLLDGPRLLTDGLEVAGQLPLAPDLKEHDLLSLAAQVSAAAGSPWGHAFPPAPAAHVKHASFNGLWAAADLDGVRYIMGPPEDEVEDSFQAEHEGGYLLELVREEPYQALGLIALRPRLAHGVKELVASARRYGVKVELLPSGLPAAAHFVGKRSGIHVLAPADMAEVIRERQRGGQRVAVVSDHAECGPGFAACDLAVGLASPRSGDFPARADILAPDLRSLSLLLETGQQRKNAVRDGVIFSAIVNGTGLVLGATTGLVGPHNASLGVYVGALAALAAGWLRLQGGNRPETNLAYLTDPRPERWARYSVADVLRALNSSENGLTDAEAKSRRASAVYSGSNYKLLTALRNQLRAPVTGLLAGGACLTLVLGQPLNTALLGLTISLNVAAGIWQEREVGKAAEALRSMSAGSARVVRNGVTVTVPVPQLVPGDIMLIGPGDRVAADARMIDAISLEIDEAALTGESVPVAKGPHEGVESGRIILEGSDVVVGTGRAVVVGVGRRTRLGATAAALNVERTEESPMGARLGRILQVALPVAGIGGFLAGMAGLIYGGPPAAQLGVAVTTALAAIPEGLPLLAGVGQAAVASRLASKKALVRRVAAIEALGRVDVTCSDKTGTMTEGRLSLRLLADAHHEASFPGELPFSLRHLLLTAALASPNPKAQGPTVHPTDNAVLRAASQAGLENEALAPRYSEVHFDSARAFHASIVASGPPPAISDEPLSTEGERRLCIKGAPEKVLARCTHAWGHGGRRPLDEAGRSALMARVVRFAERGLRMLLVAEGPGDADPENPQGLCVLGFLGISDPLRATVPHAVARCQEAGIRVIMLTGDHPATARTIAHEAGLLVHGHDLVYRAADLADITNEELDARLERVAVIARATPMDKLRVIESLRRRGHTVAMTGDGVNDAPSLRLADVGVAMGKGGTEVARQAADVVLLDDDFATLVEALVEGRGFWRNMRTALGLLLGGNAGELGLIAGTSVMGFGSPLNAVQILLVNMITDALPSLAVVLQKPESRNLAHLAREGLSALDTSLRRDVLRRGLATALPSLGAYLFMNSVAGSLQASAAAFTGVVATQLAQTLDAGRVQGSISPSVIKAVAASMAVLVGGVAIPPIRAFLGIANPSLLGWSVVGASSAVSVLLARAIAAVEEFRFRPAVTSAPEMRLVPIGV